MGNNFSFSYNSVHTSSICRSYAVRASGKPSDCEVVSENGRVFVDGNFMDLNDVRFAETFSKR